VGCLTIKGSVTKKAVLKTNHLPEGEGNLKTPVFLGPRVRLKRSSLIMTLNPTALDGRDLMQAIDIARKWANAWRKPMVVVKHPDRNHYDVIFKSRTDYKPEWVMWPEPPGFYGPPR
jgi:hypothetical protein